jgi:4-hydroxy-tetrahydrodipicolinate synthase
METLYRIDKNQVSFIRFQMPLRPGSTVALITPMTSSGAIDITELRRLVQWHIAEKTDNLCVLGTTGEASLLDMSERQIVLQTVVEEAKHTIPILVGTGTLLPSDVRTMAQQALDLGADAHLVIPPYYLKPPQRAIQAHMTQLADHIALPLVLYNVPGRTGVDIADETTSTLSQHPNIVGLKDATGNLSRVTNVRSMTPSNFLLYSGDDETSLDFVLEGGGDGCISVTANVAPNAMHTIMTLARDPTKTEDMIQTAKRINQKLDLLHRRLFVESNPIPVKYAASKLGFISSAYCRPPLDRLDPKWEALVDEALQEAGLLDPNHEP